MTCPPSKEHCYDRSDARNLIARDVIRDALKKIRPDDISVTSQLPVKFEIFMEMTKIEILEIADLAAVQPWDRSGVYNEGILDGLECYRTIRTAQTRISELEIMVRKIPYTVFSFVLG